MGDASIRAQHPAAAGTNTTLSKHLYNPGTGRYGVEASIAVDTMDWTYARFHLNFWTGTHAIESIIKINGGTGEVFYWSEAGLDVSLGHNIELHPDIHFWHKLKLVIDINKQEYVRILVDGAEFDMEGIALFNTPDVTAARLQPMLNTSGGVVQTNNIYWDNFIFTHLEP